MPHGPEEVGVGPWLGTPPEGPQYDAQMLAEGDRRNVVDRYRYWRLEAIVEDLDTRRHDFHVAIENWQHDFNIGTIVRSANAFLAREVHIVGKRRWNRRGAMVTDRYQHVRHHPTVEDRSALFDALQALPVMQRKVVVLRHWLGLSVEETAHELGISTGTVKSHSSRGIEKLQAVLTPS